MKIGIDEIIESFKIKKEIKILRRVQRIHSISGVFCLIIVSVFFILMFQWYNYYDYPIIDTSYLDEDYREYSFALLNNIDEDYIKFVRKITFYQDCMEFKKNKELGFCYVMGRNWKIDRSVEIYLKGNYSEDMETLQHEIWHSMLIGNIDAEEKIVYYFGERGILEKNVFEK